MNRTARPEAPGSRWRRSFVRFVLLTLAFVPLIVLILEIIRFHVDIPFWDQWNFVPLLGKALDGDLHISDLWQQHNEHRLIFPRLLMVGLARISAYNILHELVANILLATGILVLITWQFFRAKRALNLGGIPWVVPVFSLLVYSLNQGENWIWGWQNQIFLNALAVVGACLLFGSKRSSVARLCAAMLAGIVAAYSFANGLVFWVLGLVAVPFLPFRERKHKRAALAAWASGMAAVFFSYFCGFRFNSPSGTPWSYFLEHPAGYVRYVLQYLGAAIINYEEFALLFGAVGILFFGAMSAFFWRQGREAFRPLLPFFLLGLYAIGCAAFTGIGRVGFGTVQAMSYRYVTFSSLLWIANFVYLFLLLQFIRGKLHNRATRLSSQAAVFLFVFLLLIGIGRTSYRVGHRVFVSHHHRLAPVRQELRLNPAPGEELLLRLYVDADYVREGISVLRKHRLSVFRAPTR